MIRPLCAALLVLLLHVPAAAAQPVPKGMTMHRVGAGKLDSTGWTTAASTRGRFSVRVPVRFNDFTMETPPGDADVARIYGIGGRSAEGIKFSAQRVVYRRRGAGALFFSRIESGAALKPGAAVRAVRRIGGRRMVDVAMESRTAVGHVRYVLASDGSILTLIVEVPIRLRGRVPPAMIRQFFASLQIRPL